jgi:hypothetical protein
MKIERREFDDATEVQKSFLTEGLTGTTGSVLNNPVLPSQFDLLASTSAARAQESGSIRQGLERFPHLARN